MTEFNRGLLHGQENMKRALAEVSKAKQEYLDENERLTTLLLKAEDEAEQLKQFVAFWMHDSVLQTVQNREKFREEAKNLLTPNAN